jgi:diadenosine tetraphosphate (Ap4A) HIT family hydrolase
MAAKTDANCIFCKIIAGQIPSLKLYDSDKTYAFLGELHASLLLPFRYH